MYLLKYVNYEILQFQLTVLFKTDLKLYKYLLAHILKMSSCLCS